MSDVDSGVDSGNEDSFEQRNVLNNRQMVDNENDNGMDEVYNNSINDDNLNNLNNSISNNVSNLQVNEPIYSGISLMNSNLNQYEHYLMTIPSTSSQQPVINYANMFSKMVNNQIQNQPQNFRFTKYRENRFQPKIKFKINHRNIKFKSSFHYYLTHRDEIKQKLLMLAAQTGNVEFLCHMMCTHNRLNLNGQDKMKRTALHFAVANNHLTIASILLDYGANPNLSDIGGNTPLHLAVCTSKLDMVILLLKKGANCTLLDNNGFTPIRLAKSRLLYLTNSKQTMSIEKIKHETLEILSMLGIYSKNIQMKIHETEVASFKNRIEASKTTDEIEKDVSDLLKCLENWSL